MLIDATHEEETRVAVVEGNRLIEFDYESKLRKQLKGSIFLAKVTRVEPSLQAAFVNFGGNRHGFLPFSEIHPDYFRIPIADREALLAEHKEALEAALAAEEAAFAAEEAAFADQEARARGEIPAEEVEQPETLGGAEEEFADEEEDEPEEVGGATSESAEDESDDDGSEEDAEEEQTDPESVIESSEMSGEDEHEQDTEAEAGAEAEAGVEETAPRAGRGRHRRNDRKLSYKVITDIDTETLEFRETHETDVVTYELELAQKIKEKAETRDDVIRARLWGRENDTEDGPQMRSIWVALREDNPDVEKSDSEGDNRRGRGRGRGRGRFQGRNGGRGRGNGRGGPRQAFHNRQIEVLGGDGVEGDQPYRLNMHRNYKIQEVIKRGQIMLIQVQKEERGNKGAAVTTYLSLPGRYCVLMPNSPRGGGVSRKIASIAERRRMREILSDLPMPEGMSVILRTAGVSREQDEIKRDLDYLTRLWDNIRDLTLESSAPAMIYEESNLVKRAVRDIYSSDVEDIWVSGEKAFNEASNFMRMLMPSHVKKVQPYEDEKLPLFHRYQVENQIAEMGDPQVTLRSGGYLVIHPTEALVSIDVNSGRATKERHIEETALKTNLEAADEVARQLRLRDLGGLIVIDFIDMEDSRNNAKVERRLKEALSNDRARIQIGRISSFGLLELSRQRLNPSVTEAQFEKCSHCQGIGVHRTVDSAAILALRSLEEEGFRSRCSEVVLSVPNDIAIYILNHKRAMLADIERRYGFSVLIRVDDSLVPTGFKTESVKEVAEEESRAARMESDEGDADLPETSSSPETHDEEASPAPSRPRRSRENGRGTRDSSRRRGRGGRGRPQGEDADSPAETPEAQVEVAPAPVVESTAETAEEAKPEAPQKFRARRFQSRRTSAAEAQEPAPEQVITASVPSNDQNVAEAETGEKKKGWWNRLIEK
jgi:ribonuclease E